VTSISTQYNSVTRTAARAAQNHTETINKSIEKLSTGKRLNKAGDDAASLSISTKLDKDIRGVNQAQKNVMDAMGHMEIAEGGLLKSLDNIQRIRELMVQGLNGTNGIEEKNMLQREINGIVDAQRFINNEAYPIK
jgi:flagellin